MTAEKFIRQHKRLFVALAAYGWLRQDYNEWDEYAILVIGEGPWAIYRLRFHIGARYQFSLRGDGIVNRSYRHESSVLAALARIHKGEAP